ncbi:MAG: hypothetical protein COV66_14160 [Nitrospinae bacterium CG11_big_fil_rev_8_21_14_0_20_45_15]|nr:MAG: hypothetical protein COV66_14160 [Nitrospinae bacterium CG11_big_fil_rev_8_21_14_0_20_45_15]
MEGIKKLTVITKSVKEQTQELIDNFTHLIGEAEKRRLSAGNKFEYYKFEFADGEKNAYEDASKKLTKIMNNM